MSWKNEAHVELLKRLHKDGLSASQIATQLSRAFSDARYTRNAVIGKLCRLGLSGSGEGRHRAVATNLARAQVKRLKIKKAGAPKPLLAPAAPLAAREDETPGAATVLTLGPRMCKWPIGDPALDSFTLCGRASEEGSSYCRAHADVAHKPTKTSAEELARSLRRYA